MKEVKVTAYLWEGKRFGIEIKSKCKECNISISLIKNLLNDLLIKKTPKEP